MRLRLPGALAIGSLPLSLLLVAMVGLQACSGGEASTGQATGGCADVDGGFVCLEACSLGCSTLPSTVSGDGSVICAITDIAQNENLVLRFSQEMDPRSIDESTIQLRTATGDVPVGQFLVNGSVVEFVPSVLTVGSQSFFGFRASETYTLTIPSYRSRGPTVRSTSGDVLRNSVECTMRVTRGIVDLNGVAPRADLLQPLAQVNVPVDSIIQLRFNELIDTTPFTNSTGSNGPVAFAVARTIGQGENRICSPEVSALAGSIAVSTQGARTVLTFTPAAPLPTNSCVRISVTDQVQDLSGRPAEPQNFEFRTIEAALTTVSVVEEFDDDVNFDADASAAQWGGGTATFTQIGGDGRHGPFDLSAFTELPAQNGYRIFRVDVNNTVIPAANTVGGQPLTVDDGRFFFTEMVVPSDVRLVFVGSFPPRIAVRGRCQIDGILDVSGESLPYFESTSLSALPGQAGGQGGIYGGAGGQGGTRCIGLGAQAANRGSNGQDVRVPLGHAYSGFALGTGGRGSDLFPADGLRLSLLFPPGLTIAYVMQATSGGGGGGFLNAGSVGRAVSNQADPSGNGGTRLDFLGPDTSGGTPFPLLPLPGGANSIDHFLVGGSGGGGGGSHAALMNKTLAQAPTGNWAPGCGGGGGGGAMALRAGRELQLAPGAKLLAAGGSCGTSPTTTTALPQSAPGGGGSGGSILLQAGLATDLQGEINTSGGVGGRLDRSSLAVAPPAGGRVVCVGGDGSAGSLRLEVPGSPSIALLPGAIPPAVAANVAPLADTDVRGGLQSKFLSTGPPFGPEFVRYEIRARIDGVEVVFSDDPAVGVPAQFQFGPLEAWWQGVRMDIQTGVIDELDLLTRPWRSSVGFGASSLALDNRNAFRFQILLDRTNGQTVVLESVKVFFRI